MKQTLSVFLQLLLFYAVFGAGTVASVFFDPHPHRWFEAHPTPTATRFFNADGLLLTLGVLLLVLLVEALRKRLPRSAPWTLLAFLLAVAVGLLSKFGIVSSDLLG